MPYITNSKRSQLDREIDSLYHALVGLEADDENNNFEGNLNYSLTRLLMMVYGTKDNTRYAQINAAIGMIECMKLELYRQVAAPYENQRCFENGEVDANLPPLHTEEVVVRNLVEYTNDPNRNVPHSCDQPGFFSADGCEACDRDGGWHIYK